MIMNTRVWWYLSL